MCVCVYVYMCKEGKRGKMHMEKKIQGNKVKERTFLVVQGMQ